jgi:hypothetical protein
MSTTYRILCAVAVLVLALAPLRAGESSGAVTKGRVLVLDNDRIVEGDIERVGDQYRVRRAVGETWVPGTKVLRLCADMADAYRFLAHRANLDDPDERLRLARWCHTHGLAGQALENVRAAVELRPGHAPSRRLLEALERAAVTPAAPAPAGPPQPAEPAAVPELNNESLGQFATKVQPILMNACSRCHSNGKGGSFKLTAAANSLTRGGKSLRQNLVAVLAQVNLEHPQASPLLTKAVTAHGELAQAPLQGRALAAYRTLEEWVEKTLSTNPHLKEHGPPSSDVEIRPTSVPAMKTPSPAEPPAPEKAPSKFASGQPPPKPATSADPVDPYDPAQFNRTAQPGTGKPK